MLNVKITFMRTKKLLPFLLLIMLPFVLSAQESGRTISGVLKDSTGNGILAATIKLKSPVDSLFTRSDMDGKFTIRNVKSSQFTISVTSLGYRAHNQRFLFKDGSTPIALPAITLKSSSQLLQAVVVSGTSSITVKEDTVEYRAADYPVRENSVVEDVIRKLPGVEVDKDGNVTSQGKSITRVRVNGKDFFDGDLKSATQNLPADIIQKIQIVDDYGDQANVSGIRNGDPEKILNITISPDKNKGYLANIAAGGGFDAQPNSGGAQKNQARGMLSGMTQIMNNDEQIAGLININNTNASLFDFVGGGNQRGGRFRMGGGGGRFGGGSGGNGITETVAGGLNYRNQFGKKVSVYGSYSLQRRNNDLLSESYSETPAGGLDTIINRTSSSTFSKNISHRFNFNVEYKIDSLNYLKISPSFNYDGVKTDGSSNSVITELSRQDQGSRSLSNSKAPSFGTDLVYNHRFMRAGRNLSLGFSFNKSNNKNDQDAEDNFRFYAQNDLNSYKDSTSHRLIYTDNGRLNLSGNLVYTEPLGTYSRIDLSYNFNRTNYENSRLTDLEVAGAYVPSDSLSNVFDYSFMTNQFGVSYRYDRDKLYNFSLGVAAQPTLLDGYSATNDVSVRRTGFNIVPTARFSYNFARSRALNIDYSGSSSEPSYAQIQPVVDLSNPQRPVVGNPDLKASFSQNLNIRYNNFDPEKGIFFIVGANASIAKDRVVSNVVRLRQPIVNNGDTTYNLIQETRYLNADGYFSGRMFYGWSKPFMDRKYTIRLNGNVNFTNDVGYLDNQENTIRNFSFTQRVQFQLNPNENIDINPQVSYTKNLVNYSLPTSIDANNTAWNFELNSKLYFFKTFIWGLEATKTINQGYVGGIAANPLILNSYIEKQFMNRRARLRLQGYDLLNQGVNVAPSYSNGSYVQSSTNRLTRYFLFSFAYRLNKFGGKENNRDFGPGGPGGPGGMRPPRF